MLVSAIKMAAMGFKHQTKNNEPNELFVQMQFALQPSYSNLILMKLMHLDEIDAS